MLAFVPLGSELERIMGSIRLSYITILLATSNALLNLLIAALLAHNPFYPFPIFMDECAIGFSGILFSMIVIETSLSGAQHRRYIHFSFGVCNIHTRDIYILNLTGLFCFCSVFGLFNVPAQWYM